MTKHTPTPWDICKSANSNLVHIETALDNPIIGGEQIATVNKGDIDTRMANAAFIVKAVNAHDDLVRALEEAEHALSGAPNTVGLHIQINKALAKAKGEA